MNNLLQSADMSNTLMISLSDFLDDEFIERKVLGFDCGLENGRDINVFVKALKISDESIYVGGQIEGSYMLECSKCLTPYKQPVNIKISTDVDFIDGVVDVGEEVRQLLILEMPDKPVCSIDCLGICPKCGKKNIAGDGCSCNIEENEIIDERWKDLLKFKMSH